MTRAYLLSIPPTKRTNSETFFWSSQCLPCWYLLIFSHLDRSDVIGLYLCVSASASPILTSIMASTWRSHKHQIITSPLVSLCLSLTWCISSSDLVRPLCIRGLARTDAEVKARWYRLRIFSQILLWRAMTRPSMLQLIFCVTPNAVPHPPQWLWRFTGEIF